MPEVDVILTGGRAFVAGRLADVAIAVRDGRIVGISDMADAPAAKRCIDTTGRVVLPGLIDSHVHLRDPGATYKEDIVTGTRAAAAGGFTLVADMPNSSPITKGTQAIKNKAAAIDEKAVVNVAIWAAATTPEEVVAARGAGATGIKVFLNGPVDADASAEFDPARSSFNPELTFTDYGQLLGIAEAAAQTGLPLAVHVGEQAILDRDRRSWDGRPFADILDELESETALEKRVGAAACIEIALETGVWLHVVHVPGSVVPLIQSARSRGANVTIESFFPFMTFHLARTLGPLGFNRYKSVEETEQLWSWIKDGTIEALASDHAPHLLEEKERGNHDILSCPSGYPELETSAAMVLNEVAEGRFGLDVMVRAMSAEPARILGVGHRKGRIEVGYDADFTVVDPEATWTLGSRPYETKCDWSPYTGREVRGRVETTIVRGVPVFANGELVGSSGHGTHVVPQR